MKLDDPSGPAARRSSDATPTHKSGSEPSDPLSLSDQRELERCERLIQEHERAFCEYARALFRIRDLRLYRAKFNTFEDYCRATIGKSRKYASRIAQAGEMIELLPEDCRVLVSNEHCARKLMNVVPDKRGEVLLEAHRLGVGVTGASISKAARKMKALVQGEASDEAKRPAASHMSRAAATPAVEVVIKKTLERLAGRVTRISDNAKAANKSQSPEWAKQRLLAAAGRLDAPLPQFHVEARRLLLEGVQHLASIYLEGEKREAVLRLKPR